MEFNGLFIRIYETEIVIKKQCLNKLILNRDEDKERNEKEERTKSPVFEEKPENLMDSISFGVKTSNYLVMHEKVDLLKL